MTGYCKGSSVVCFTSINRVQLPQSSKMGNDQKRSEGNGALGQAGGSLQAKTLWSGFNLDR